MPSNTSKINLQASPAAVKACLKKADSSLSEREKAILKSRFIDNDILANIAKRFHVSLARIRQILLTALYKMDHASR